MVWASAAYPECDLHVWRTAQLDSSCGDNDEVEVERGGNGSGGSVGFGRGDGSMFVS